jgi:hypothetical protein
VNELSALGELGTRFAELAEDSSKDFDVEEWPADQWAFIGVGDQPTFESFKDAAKRGAELRGCPAEKLEKLSSYFWLDQLKRHGTHYEFTTVIGPGSHGEPGEYEQRGIIRRVCKASAEYCQSLVTRAMAADRKSLVPQQVAESRAFHDRDSQNQPEKPQFPERAKWLKVKLKERGWGRQNPYKYRGPDPKTIDRILRGDPVRDGSLQTLAAALSAKGLPVNLRDIPND